ncbi:hypothetical protein [Streptomyces sp. NPDC048269]|uniref:hypothetical protein n=1 Tax=Streptomyces sp. NPDC048269 TaxID=3155753 RepID=UPI0034303E98
MRGPGTRARGRQDRRRRDLFHDPARSPSRPGPRSPRGPVRTHGTGAHLRYGGEDARATLLQALLSELQDAPRVRENSTTRGELRAGAVFHAELREPLAESTRSRSQDTADAVSDAQAAGLADLHVASLDAAERLTALVEGLGERWLSGSLTLERARGLLTGAVETELGPRPT